ncbi:hypothetical protein B0F90DRAFT_1809627 [Multifurca ochricompacta]|uniref:Uncharacterized protein n=1 Tax=Multifurca ochricompacta TaxID=376703 RepID=A0AAD4M8A5_9AGAM|nr:hypothetical protein B0F90DRAFT_1809627 [Multifurca ochricompacta]
MVDKQARKSKHGTILFEPFIVYRIHHKQSLSQVTRSKLSLVIGVGAKDSCSLHRWVLLKNSITRSQPNFTVSCSPINTSELLPSYEDEEVCCDVEHDSFIYPDARKLLDSPCSVNDNSSEKQWFDSLMESLECEESDDSNEPVSLLHIGDDDDDEDELPPLTPSASPMSSTDDLSHPVYNNTPISMPYPVVYPPHDPPLLSPLELQPLNTSLDSHYPPFHAALPYTAEGDIDDLPVPDTVEDFSDDESDAPSTPTPDTRSPSLSLVDASARSSERARRHVIPQVYVNADDSYFHPSFELDPLPFSY